MSLYSGGGNNAAVGVHAMNVYLSDAGDKLFNVLHYNINIYYIYKYEQFFFYLLRDRMRLHSRNWLIDTYNVSQSVYNYTRQQIIVFMCLYR